MAYALDQDNYRSKRSYIATAAFHQAIYTYTTALNPTTFKQEGRLALATLNGQALTAAQCPAGRILRENGRKLYPGVNAGLLSGDTFQGVANFQGATEAANRFWVGVFDAVTGVKGFINPNASTFDVYNSDKSLEVVDINETNGSGLTGGRFPLRTVTEFGSSGAQTLTVTQLLNGIVTQASTGAIALNLPSATAIIAAMGGTIGTSADFIYSNTTANNVTLTAGTGGTTTITGSAIVNNAVGRFIITITNATTVTIFRV